MSGKGFSSKHGVVKNNIREDIIYFGIPAIIVFTSGLTLSFFGDNGLGFFLKNQPMFSLQHIAGFIIMFSGGSIQIVSQVSLRKSYHSTLVIKENYKLKTNGMYRFIRHPMYLGVTLFSIGLPIFFINFYGFLVMLLMIPVFLSRIRIEEKMLIEAFGDEYTEYVKNTKKLFPFIY